MIGLAILFFFGVYLLMTLWVTSATTAWARRNNRSQLKWGGLAAFVMYNLVFWDWLPTVVAHQYYCATEAGFTVYKTPEQWKAENPNLTAEDLKPLSKNKNRLWAFPYKPLNNGFKKTVLMVNLRIYHDTYYEENILYPIPISIRKSTSFMADTFDNKKLAQVINFERGYGNMMTASDWRAMKFWLSKKDCGISKNGNEWEATGYNKFLKQMIKLGE